MNAVDWTGPVAAAAAGLTVTAGALLLEMPAFALQAGDALVAMPQSAHGEAELAAAMARVLATLLFPQRGTLELLGGPVAGRSYVDLLKLRRRIGFVQGRGGLLSNRTLRDNIALPLTTHAGLGQREEALRVQDLVEQFGLAALADSRPHEVDGTARFRACAARAVALDPQWVVAEGTGDFGISAGLTAAWQRLLEQRQRSGCALAVCLSRPAPAFAEAMARAGAAILPVTVTAASSGGTA